MTRRIPSLLIPLILVFSLTSCKTYVMSVESFRQQFQHLDSSYASAKATPIWSTGFHHGNDTFLVHGHMRIRCQDAQQRDHILNGGPSTEIRFTYGPDNRRATVYFDTMFLTDSTVTGQRSRSMPWLRTRIPLNSITKIELQDDGKRYPYVNP
jgi:hypothetical protein